MLDQIKAAVLALRKIRARRGSRLSPSPSSVLEGRYHTALVTALQAVAAYHGLELQEPIEVLKNGELSLVSLSPTSIPSGTAYESFGPAFAAALTAHHARPAAGSDASVIPATGYWCYLHYIHAENLVNEYYERLATPLEVLPEAAERPGQAPIDDAKLAELIAFLDAHVTSSGVVNAVNPLSAHLYREAAVAVRLLQQVRVAAHPLNPAPTQVLSWDFNRGFAVGWQERGASLRTLARNEHDLESR